MPAEPARAASTAAFSERMLVWNAISSIVLMMCATRRLDSLIAVIASTVSASAAWDWSTCFATALTSRAACEAFSTLLRVIDAISSIEADVSSSEAACSEHPCASVSLDEQTWLAAMATCRALSVKSLTDRRNASFTARITKKASAPLTARHTRVPHRTIAIVV